MKIKPKQANALIKQNQPSQRDYSAIPQSAFPLLEAQAIADGIVARLSSFCKKIKVAGSIRRKSPFVGDIEIVALPIIMTTPTLFGGTEIVGNALEAYDFNRLGKVIKGGSKYKQIELPQNINLDLFIVTPPAQWGAIFMIRTGPKEFSKKMVTVRRYGGHLPSNYRQRDGAVWDRNRVIPMESERDYFELCEIDFVEPEAR